jgi:hypothetical protein
MQKLNEKGQSADKQKQAYQSVKVYLDIVANEKKQDDNQKFRDGNEVKTLNVASSDTAIDKKSLFRRHGHPPACLCVSARRQAGTGLK